MMCQCTPAESWPAFCGKHGCEGPPAYQRQQAIMKRLGELDKIGIEIVNEYNRKIEPVHAERDALSRERQEIAIRNGWL